MEHSNSQQQVSMAESAHLAPATLKRLLKEFAGIAAAPMEGVMLLPNDDDLTCVQALIEGPVDTPYHGGIFRVRLKLGNDFPMAPPKGVFVTKIFHPNVSASGEICVNTLKRDWSPALGIKHILLTIKCLLIVPNPDSALNDEAGKMLSDRYEDYCQRAASWTAIHASSKKERDVYSQHRASLAAATASTASTASTTASTAADTEILVDAAAADAARSASTLAIDGAPTNDSANADASSQLAADGGADADNEDEDGEGAIDKENNKSNEPIAAARLAAQSDVPAAKKPKSAASVAKPTAAAAAKKKLNRRL